ncbi:MAG: hypothetical protein D6694_11530 [Gammaproteobacteria bacterium]|nr:MAG: hypothetical protein D6694_11530 [Gammaproteobacteria bacterium]
MPIPYNQARLVDAVRAVKEYNSGHNMGTPNYIVDQWGYDMFKHGISGSKHHLIRQLHWLSVIYKGIAYPEGKFIEEIAGRIINNMHTFHMLNRLRPLSERTPSRIVIDKIWTIFTNVHTSGSKKKNYITLCTKLLHFIRPDIFIPCDERVKNFFIGRKHVNPNDYQKILVIVKDIINGKDHDCPFCHNIRIIRKMDWRWYHGDVKMVDKIAFVCGK